MREFVKKAIMGILAWVCFIWVCSFDPKQLGEWLHIACWIGGITWFWWFICGFESPFRKGDEVA